MNARLFGAMVLGSCFLAVAGGMPAAAQPAAPGNGTPARAFVLVPGIMAGPGTFGPIGFRRLCDPRSVGLTQWRSNFLTRALKVEGDQKKALAELEQSSSKAAAMFSAACPRTMQRPRTSPAQLEMMQGRLEAALEAVKTVRPAFDAFYRTLDDRQKLQLDTLGPKRHGWRL